MDHLETFKATYLDTILAAYLETLIWQGSNWDDLDECGNPASLDHFDSSAFDEAALASSREDVEGFIDCAFEALGPAAFEGLNRPSFTGPQFAPDLIGHNFALSRNGHGAGFFDSGARFSNELQDLCRPWGEVDLYVYERDGEEWLGIR